MSTVVHGFREYFIARCRRTGDLVLKGKYGMHLHENPSPRAECRGISTASWLTPRAREILQKPPAERKQFAHDPLDVPHMDCTDGYYVFRRYLPLTKHQLKYSELYHVAAHVTAIGKVILHEDGARVQSYRLDYLLSPPAGLGEIYICTADPSPDYPYHWPSERVNVAEVVDKIAQRFGVPVLEPDDPRGCVVCQIANGWVHPDDVGEIVVLCTCRNKKQDEQYGFGMRKYRRESDKWRCSSCGKETDIPILTTEVGKPVEVQADG